MSILQLNFDGQDKIAVALSRIRDYEPQDGYHLAFSGGKDSIVIHHLAETSGVHFDAHYNVSPIDPPEIYRFIQKNYPNVAWDRNAKGFWLQVPKHGLPTRWRRWCCRMIKEAGGKGRTVMMGVRRHESISRRGRSVFAEDWKVPGRFFCLPIVDWTGDEVWEYINAHNLPYCGLYDEGYERLGCVMCPLTTGKQRRRDAERWPKIARNWKSAARRFFEKKQASDRPLEGDFEGFWRWWLNQG